MPLLAQYVISRELNIDNHVCLVGHSFEFQYKCEGNTITYNTSVKGLPSGLINEEGVGVVSS